MGSGDKIIYLTRKNMKYISCLIVILLIQNRVQCELQNEDETLIDHSNDEDRTHVNEWVIHVTKGKYSFELPKVGSEILILGDPTKIFITR